MIYTANAVLICALLVSEQFDFREYIDRIYLAMTSIAFNIQFTYLIVTMNKLFIIIEMIDEIIENRESNPQSLVQLGTATS